MNWPFRRLDGWVADWAYGVGTSRVSALFLHLFVLHI